MKKTYMKPVTETFDIEMDQQLLETSITDVTTDGLGNDPVIDQLIGGGTDGLPIPAPIGGAW